eukprot:gene26037-biopygen13186
MRVRCVLKLQHEIVEFCLPCEIARLKNRNRLEASFFRGRHLPDWSPLLGMQFLQPDQKQQNRKMGLSSDGHVATGSWRFTGEPSGHV